MIDLKNKKAELEKQFKEIEDRRQAIVKEHDALMKKLIELQGRYAQVKELMEETPGDTK